MGVGGYASSAALGAANSLGIPTLLQEQNSYAGLANKNLAAKASKICVAYEGMERFFPADKIMMTGNPVRQQLLDTKVTREEALKTFEATKANLTEANENLRIAQIGFKEGVATADDVLAAQTAWLKAHSEEVDAEIDVRMCDVYLAKVLGKMNY